MDTSHTSYTLITDTLVQTFDELETVLDYLVYSDYMDMIDEHTLKAVIVTDLNNKGAFVYNEFTLLEEQDFCL